MSGSRSGIGRFTSEEARQAFEVAYERAMTLWPDDREALDIGTSYGTTRVYRHGAGQGRPIVLVHGHGGNASNWYGLVAQLGRHRPVYAIDNVDDPGGSVQTAPLTDPGAWLEEVLAGLHLHDVHLVGHSYGGWLMLGLAVRGSDRLSALTLIDPGGLQPIPARFLLGLFASLLAMRAPASWKPGLARLLADAGLVERPEIMAPVLVGVRAFRPNRTPARTYTDDELRRVTVPTQVILGGRSRMLRPARALARARLMGSLRRTEVVPGVGHGVPQEVPRLVCERILGFGGARLEETP